MTTATANTPMLDANPSGLVSASSSGLGSSGNVSLATPSSSRKESGGPPVTIAADTGTNPIQRDIPKLSLGSHLGPAENFVGRQQRSTKEIHSLQKCYSADEASLQIKADTKNLLTGESIIFEDKEVVSGIHVRASTVEQLENETIKAFEASSTNYHVPRSEFIRVMMLMHKWFIDSDKLAEDFVTRSALVNVPLLDAIEPDTSPPFSIETVKRIFRYWIETYPMDFHNDSALMSVIVRFSESLKTFADDDLEKLIECRLTSSHEWCRGSSGRREYPKKSHDATDKVSLVFNQIAPEKLAQQLTVLEFKAFRRITFFDIKNYATSGNLKESCQLEKSICLFNGLSQWVQCMILSKTTPEERGQVILKFVEIANALLKQQNFTSFFAMVGGITHSAITRLSKTTGSLPAEIQKTIHEYIEILSSSNNFSVYRKLLGQAKGFFIPVLGVHLKDIVSYHAALSNFEGEELINFRKMAQLSSTFGMISDCQYETLPFEENKDLCNTLRLSLDLNYTEEEIYELSMAREPRNSSSPYTPSKSVVFAEWVSGVKPPNPNTVKKHVHDMVEAVFKVYDHDKDGFISHEEFDQIADNFPFIDSFAVLDADNDGAISKMELKSYFIRANCHALRNSFKHDFHENTYFKPTYCAHCTGLLWGLIKQGWRCRVCSINAHKHCKDLVVMECRSRHSSFHQRTSSTNQEVGGTSECGPAGSGKGPNLSPVSSPKKRHNSHAEKPHRGYMSSQQRARHRQGLIQQHSTPRDVVSSTRSSIGTQTTLLAQSRGSFGESEIYEDAGALYDRLTRTEEERDKLLLETNTLKEEMDRQKEQIVSLRNHIGNIRQRTLNFILGLMETLKIQRDSEV